ncbi:MAG: phospholipase C, phosphocholine-specific [Zavarzinia sp.]|nr:phospholipase C, phosphocholine-specific [Zavarzinia sp.]
MTDKSRRDFLKSAAVLTGASAAATAFPPSIMRALAIQANNATKSIMDVEHVVILMQENRSFDHYFGMMPGVRGFGDRFTIPLPGERSVFEQSNGSRIVMPYHLDQTAGNAQRVSGTPHSWGNAQNAWDNGRMANWPTYKEDQSMGYYTEQELEFQYALANAFTLCDSYHCGIHAGTNPNRLFHWTGTNGPTGKGVAAVYNEWDTLGPSEEGYEWTTYPERLEKAGVDWKVYQFLPDNFSDNPLHGFKTYRAASEAIGNSSSGFPYWAYISAYDKRQPLYKGCSNTMPLFGLLEDFKRDIRWGKLPQISWIVAPSNYSEHPGPSSPVQGAWYIQEALDALTAKPEIWAKTALIVNFDENDGFFDHMPSPALFSMNADGTPAGATTMADTAGLDYERFIHPNPPGTTGQGTPDGRVYGPGPRVPCYVISPWSKGGWVNSQVFDHTSVIRFLEKRFGVMETNISPYRRTVCGDLMSCFDFVNPNAEIPTLPSRSKASADTLRVSQDLKEQIPTPDESVQFIPTQAVGTKPSRALPYVLHATAAVTGDTVSITFKNSGTQAAVFHVYDKLHLDRIPHRYMVEAGKELTAGWPVGGDDGAYDLWVLGPNGFHRHFTGDTRLAGGSGLANPEVAVTYSPSDNSMILAISNRGSRSCVVTVTANAYENYAVTKTVAAGRRVLIARSLQAQGNWYDFTVAIAGTNYARRVAGRMETGRDSVSDPAAVLAPIVAAG